MLYPAATGSTSVATLGDIRRAATPRTRRYRRLSDSLTKSIGRMFPHFRVPPLPAVVPNKPATPILFLTYPRSPPVEVPSRLRLGAARRHVGIT